MSELQTLGKDFDQEWEGKEERTDKEMGQRFTMWGGVLEAQVAITEFHGEGVLNNRNGLSHSFGDWKSETRVLPQPGAGERPRAGLDIAAFSWALTWHVGVGDSRCTGAHCGISSDKDNNPLRSEPHPGDLT